VFLAFSSICMIFYGLTKLWAPEEVVEGRWFRVVLQTARDGVLSVEYDDSLSLFDRTPDGVVQSRFYLLARKPASKTTIKFTEKLPDGSTSTLEIPLKILSREEVLSPRRLGEIQLPRRWPISEDIDEMKTEHTFITLDRLKAIRKTYVLKKPGITPWVEKSDEYLWELLPPSEIPRWHWVNLEKGCPIHGKEIYREQGFYPWRIDIEGHPWKVQCPIGGEWYPSNDFGSGDMTSGDFPDDGYGCLYKGDKYAFIAVHAQARAYAVHSAVDALVRSYIQTGDGRCAHKLGILLVRLADEFGYLSGYPQHRYSFQSEAATDPSRLGPDVPKRVSDLNRSGHSTYCIALAGEYPSFALAYDLLFEKIARDEELLEFVKGKGINVNTGEELRRYIEDNLFRVGAQTVMDGGAASNLPRPQEALASIALCLNYERCRELIRWLYDGGGQMRYFLANFYFKDGSAYESTGGYNGIHVAQVWKVESLMERLRKLRPELYPDDEFPSLRNDPKYKAVFDFPVDIVCADVTYPMIGDVGPTPSARKLPKKYVMDMPDVRGTYEYAFKTFRDPKFAKVLRGMGYKPTPESDLSETELEELIGRHGVEIERESQVFDGYGIAILRSGETSQMRALWMYYGHARGHTHDDFLDIGLVARERNLMAHMGYPYSWVYRNEWEGNWLTHYCVRVLGEPKGRRYVGAMEFFAGEDGIGVMEAFGRAYLETGDPSRRYRFVEDDSLRRTLVLVDLSDEDFYVVDIFRVEGGEEHFWSFHGNQGEVETEGLVNPTPQSKGTAAGEEVEYGEVEGVRYDDPAMRSLAYLYNVVRANVKGRWSADWKLKDADGIHLRMEMLSPESAEVISADGRPPQAPTMGGPYEIKWFLVHRRGEPPLRTQFVNLIQLYTGKPIVRGERIKPIRRGNSKFEPIILKVESESRIDWIFSHTSPDEVVRAEGGFEFKGRFGIYSETPDGRFKSALLIGELLAKEGGERITLSPAEYSAEILSLNREENWIEIELPDIAEDITGSYISISNGKRRGFYRVIRSERRDGVLRLWLDCTSKLGEGRALRIEGNRIKTEAQFPLSGHCYYLGTRLVAPDGREFVVDHIRGDVVVNDSSEGELRKSLPKGTIFAIYDYGVGDKVTFVRCVREP
jgi:hypothetical protein